MAFKALSEIVDICEEKGISFGEAVCLYDCGEQGISREESRERMWGMWRAMQEAVALYDKNLRSNSGLVGGFGGRMRDYVQRGESITGNFVGEVIAAALAMGESNACMRRIVAAPTAGACGVLPAVLVTYDRQRLSPAGEKAKRDEEVPAAILESLYVAAGIGQVIAVRAYIAGASGGCQAEIGSAGAMAAGALVSLRGGTPEQICHGAAMALKNLLGLVCDPVAGLVEVPCVKRNVIGAMAALSAADMSLAGIISQIPPDQVIDAMKEIGDKMHKSLKETGEGGLAATPAGKGMEMETETKNPRGRELLGAVVSEGKSI